MTGFDPTNPGWAAEAIRAGEESRRDFLGQAYEKAIQRYVGSGFKQGWNAVDLENHGLQQIATFLPQMAANNPEVSVGTPRWGEYQDDARGLQYGLNRNIADQDLRREVEKWAVDFVQRWAVAVTIPEGVPSGVDGFDDPVDRPRSKRLSLKHFVWDPAAMGDWDQAYWTAHLVFRRREEILAEAKKNPHLGWNTALLTDLPVDEKLEEYGRQKGLSVHRGDVGFYEIHVPSHTLSRARTTQGDQFDPSKERGYKGTILTLPLRAVDERGADDGAPDWLRDPRPFHGPASGPYTVGGCYYVPDELVHLSPTLATYDQDQEINDYRAACTEAIEAYKRLVAVDAAAPDAEEKIRDARNDLIVAIEGLDEVQKQIIELEIGGLSDHHMLHMEFLQRQRDRTSGTPDTAVGRADPNTPATNTMLANQGYENRRDWPAFKFLSFVEGVLRKEAWYLWEGSGEEDAPEPIPLGQGAAGVFVGQDGTPIERPVWIAPHGAPAETLEELEIRIELFSLRYNADERRQIQDQELDFVVTTVLPLIPTMPFFDWKAYLKRRGERVGLTNLPDMVDVDLAVELAMQGQAPELQGQPQPRLPADMGKRLLPAGAAGGLAGRSPASLPSIGAGPTARPAAAPTAQSPVAGAAS